MKGKIANSRILPKLFKVNRNSKFSTAAIIRSTRYTHFMRQIHTQKGVLKSFLFSSTRKNCFILNCWRAAVINGLFCEFDTNRKGRMDRKHFLIVNLLLPKEFVRMAVTLSQSSQFYIKQEVGWNAIQSGLLI